MNGAWTGTPSTRRFAFGLIILLLTTGCIERKLIVRVEPTEARVFLDGLELETEDGEATFEYTHEGTRRLVARARGYETAEQWVDLEPRWYAVFPLDFVTELLNPWTIHDVREARMTLEPLPPSSGDETDALVKRGREAAEEAGVELR